MFISLTVKVVKVHCWWEGYERAVRPLLFVAASVTLMGVMDIVESSIIREPNQSLWTDFVVAMIYILLPEVQKVAKHVSPGCQ